MLSLTGLAAPAADGTSSSALGLAEHRVGLYAKALAADGILVNAAAPGACATDFTRNLPYPVTRTAAQGAAIAVRLATIGADGPTGGFFDDDGPVPW